MVLPVPRVVPDLAVRPGPKAPERALGHVSIVPREPRRAPPPRHELEVRAVNLEHVWGAWMGGRPATTVRARVADLRALAEHLDAADELDAVRRIIAAGPSQARSICHGWATEQRDRGVADATTARRLATLGSLFRELELAGLPWGLVIRRPPVPRYQARACPSWAAVLEVARGLAREGRVQELAALWFLAACGLRRAEVVSLRWSNVTLGHDTTPSVTVRRKGGRVVTRTISRNAATALRALAELRAEAGETADEILLGQRGPLTADGLAAWVERWGLMSPHALRRAGATELHRRGASPALIRAWLDHASLATTQVYVLELDDDAGRATAYLEAAAT